MGYKLLKKNMEIKQLELATEKEKETFYAVLNNANDCIFLYALDEFDRPSSFLFINQKVKELLGYGEESKALTFRDIADPINYQKIVGVHDHKRFTEDTNWVGTLFAADGRTVQAEMSLRTFIINRQKVGLGIARDITTRKKIENQLQESRQRYKSLFENTLETIFTFDTNGNIERTNELVVDLLGYSAEEILKRSWNDFVDENEWKKLKFYFMKSVRGRPQEYETVLIHKDGHQVDVRVKHTPIEVNDKTAGVFILLKDITEEKQSTRIIAETKEQLELFWNHSADAIFLIDDKGNILKVNQTFEYMFGYNEHDVIGENPRVSIIPNHLREKLENIKAQISEGKTIPYYETERLHKDGQTLYILASYAPIKDSRGNVTAAVCFYKDITMQKQTESILKNVLEELDDVVKSGRKIPAQLGNLFKKIKVGITSSRARGD
jgi:PAS domain S-box-containing protein